MRYVLGRSRNRFNRRVYGEDAYVLIRNIISTKEYYKRVLALDITKNHYYLDSIVNILVKYGTEKDLDTAFQLISNYGGLKNERNRWYITNQFPNGLEKTICEIVDSAAKILEKGKEVGCDVPDDVLERYKGLSDGVSLIMALNV